VITHRYAGLVMGLLMLLWFASGVGMLFIRWPEVTEAEREAGLPPITWSACCEFGETPDVREVARASVEDLAGRPVLRFDGEVLDLTTGWPITEVTADDAARIAAAYARAHGVAGAPSAPDRTVRDQWTVTGYFDARRPFWRFRFDDPAATDVYVSAKTGVVAQVTDRPERILSWLGPIPHWLYPEALRADLKLWTQVVIWTSVAGMFLTVTGVYLGIVAWRPWRDQRLTPYRGLMAWHHLGGLAAGVLTLSWVASGLLSMQPWGILESGPDERPSRMTGSVSFGDVREAVTAAASTGIVARRLETAPLSGHVFLVESALRLDRRGEATPLADADLAEAARRLGPVRRAELITTEDAYYFGHHEAVELPAYRVELTDGVRFYLSPASGGVLARIDAAAKQNRWLFEAPHRLDFIRGLDRGPGWAAVVTALLLFCMVGVGSGVWLAWRRVKADVALLRRPRRTSR
jgi:hypothetical protein